MKLAFTMTLTRSARIVTGNCGVFHFFLLRVRVRHLQSHVELGVGADGHAEGVLRGGCSGIAGVGDRSPASCQQRLAPLGVLRG